MPDQKNTETDLGEGELSPQAPITTHVDAAASVSGDTEYVYDPMDTDITNPNIQRTHVLAQWRRRQHER